MSRDEGEGAQVYGVLLVDDEKLVRDGLARKVEWGRFSMRVVGEAPDGERALDLAGDPAVQIVITDIKMPGLDGLELIRRATAARPELRFVVLSGFDEFELARQAMRHGVRHYLLKPTKPAEIARVLAEVSRELAAAEEERRETEQVRARLEQSLPLIREQFLRDLIMGRLHTGVEVAAYHRFFGLPDAPLTLVLMALGGAPGFEDILLLRLTAERVFGPQGLALDAVVKDRLALLTALEEPAIVSLVEETRASLTRRSPKPLTAALAGPLPLERVSELYSRAEACLQHRFHYGEGSVITERDVVSKTTAPSSSDIEYYKGAAAHAVRCGSEADFRAALQGLLRAFSDQQLDRSAACTHATDLLLAVARQEDYRGLPATLEAARAMERASTIEDMGAVALAVCDPLIAANYAQLRSKRSILVERVKECIAANLSNEELSLKWLAENLVYANVDYLSKAFKRETGENFNHHVTRLRMERATALLREAPAMPVAQVAAAVGYGDNAQYFSRVFRAHSGLTPSGYRGLEP